MSSKWALYTVYFGTSDFPDKYVVRRWVVEGGQSFPDANPTAIADTLEEARRLLDIKAPGLTRLPRNPLDDKVIVESWI